MLGDVEETVYVVEEDEDEEDVVKASSPLSLSLPPNCPSLHLKSILTHFL